MIGICSRYRPAASWPWIALFLAAAPCSALEPRIELSPPPVSALADTEVSTNVPFSVADGTAVLLELAFVLDGNPSNCVQVAFGHDANANSVLDFGETETMYGCRNGYCFAENTPGGIRIEEPYGAINAASRSFAIDMRLSKDHSLMGFSATNSLGTAIFTDLSLSAPNWLYRQEWNLMRVTRRGAGVPAEWFACNAATRRFQIRIH